MAVLRFNPTTICKSSNARIRISQVSWGPAGPDTLFTVVVRANGDPATRGHHGDGPCISGTDDHVGILHIGPQHRVFLLIGTSTIKKADTLCAMVVELEGDGVTMDACTFHPRPGASAELSVLGGDPVFGYVWSPNFYLSDPTSPRPQ